MTLKPIQIYDTTLRDGSQGEGVSFSLQDKLNIARRLAESGIDFIIEPHTRFKGEPGEQSTMFFLDPCGNALEFKAFKSDDMIFAVD